VTLTLDEFEVIRLVDFERRTHEQCADMMDVSRTTVTEIYESARFKLADSIVNGKRLEIAGGNYRLCDGSANPTCGKRCKKAGHPASDEKGENIMRIAVTYDNDNIFQHFGHTAQFKVYDVEDGKIVKAEVVDTNGSGHGALAGFLVMQRVDAVAAALGTTRSAVVLAAIRLLSREVRSRGGYLVPPYEGEDILASLQRSDTLQNEAPEEP
jgi:hypothetical protein